jgi:hypothetical protein
MAPENPEDGSVAGRSRSLVKMASEAGDGRLEALKCPACDSDSVSVWFSNPTVNVFRTWFICTECKFESRAQNTARPGFYSEERRRHDLEERDRETSSKAVFPEN